MGKENYTEGLQGIMMKLLSNWESSEEVLCEDRK